MGKSTNISDTESLFFVFFHVVIPISCVHLFFSKKCEFPRAWILSLMKDNIENAEVQFFVSHFLPQAAHLRERGKIIFVSKCLLLVSYYSGTTRADFVTILSIPFDLLCQYKTISHPKLKELNKQKTATAYSEDRRRRRFFESTRSEGSEYESRKSLKFYHLKEDDVSKRCELDIRNLEAQLCTIFFSVMPVAKTWFLIQKRTVSYLSWPKATDINTSKLAFYCVWQQIVLFHDRDCSNAEWPNIGSKNIWDITTTGQINLHSFRIHVVVSLNLWGCEARYSATVFETWQLMFWNLMQTLNSVNFFLCLYS